MSNLRWDPFRDLSVMQDRLNRMFQEGNRFRGEETLTGTVVPPVDIYETEHALVLEADIPGLNLNELDIRVENNTLTVRGERKPSFEVKDENFHRVERAYGSFSRTFSLPNTVDAEKITASYNNGVLQVNMAKREETKPKQIRVQVQNTVEAGKDRKAVA